MIIHYCEKCAWYVERSVICKPINPYTNLPAGAYPTMSEESFRDIGINRAESNRLGTCEYYSEDK